MAWAKTTKLGCGVQYCSDGGFTIVVCNYSPAGNYINQLVYQAGAPCSQCITAYSDQLCAPPSTDRRTMKTNESF
ncbi:cysteine-rich secretory protein family domain-containing protein [Ditylenchus destructor]|uniref:Cysteine-rich secretory protein family domain-containing protein n=1 Tax=Ditylenchus destructor TaxID=166010 RepID=A0AAD4MVL1_9BILA|nr:cysteine-rich secretory protein family domain-containing protein [Ditylenchus destructor]